MPRLRILKNISVFYAANYEAWTSFKINGNDRVWRLSPRPISISVCHRRILSWVSILLLFPNQLPRPTRSWWIESGSVASLEPTSRRSAASESRQSPTRSTTSSKKWAQTICRLEPAFTYLNVIGQPQPLFRSFSIFSNRNKKLLWWNVHLISCARIRTCKTSLMSLSYLLNTLPSIEKMQINEQRPILINMKRSFCTHMF